jgi:hypothetical protein
MQLPFVFEILPENTTLKKNEQMITNNKNNNLSEISLPLTNVGLSVELAQHQ